MKKSLLALAVSLAAASGAHAAWDYGVNPAGGGELLLAVWDANTGHQTSVAVDTGVQFADLASHLTDASYTLTLNLDATAFNTAFATSNKADLRYSLISISNDQSFFPSIMATTNALNPVVNANANTAITAASPITASYVNTENNYALNGSTVGTTANGRYLGSNSVYGNNFTQTSFPFSIADSVSNKLAFYQFNSPDATDVADVKALGVWSIDLSNLNAATLTYGPAAPAVPVPGAAWLMGSALVGLGSIARRRRV